MAIKWICAALICGLCLNCASTDKHSVSKRNAHSNIDEVATFVGRSGVAVDHNRDGTPIFPNTSSCKDALNHFVRTQQNTLRVVAENLLNKDVEEKQNPYRRRYVELRPGSDGDIRFDYTPFPIRYDPADPLADKDGYVLMSNVVPMAELTIGLRAEEEKTEAESVLRALSDNSISPITELTNK